LMCMQWPLASSAARLRLALPVSIYHPTFRVTPGRGVERMDFLTDGLARPDAAKPESPPANFSLTELAARRALNCWWRRRWHRRRRWRVDRRVDGEEQLATVLRVRMLARFVGWTRDTVRDTVCSKVRVDDWRRPSVALAARWAAMGFVRDLVCNREHGLQPGCARAEEEREMAPLPPPPSSHGMVRGA